MNLYDVLRKLVEARQWTDEERASALRLLSELEQVNALGTMTGSLAEAGHQCVAKGSWFPESVQCGVCGGRVEPPLHACVPMDYPSATSGWGPARVAVKCGICGKGMS